jgi:hypothetical protein
MSEILLMALGAALMYFFDPVSGRQRRAWLRDQWDRWGGKKGTATAPTTATAPRYTAAEQSVAEPTPSDRAAAPPTDEAGWRDRRGTGRSRDSLQA